MEEIELIPVEGHTTLGRDPASNAILNTDTTQYEAYIKARNEARKKEKEIKDLKDEVEELKRLVNDLVRKEDK
jgi:predicted AlkP superfamily phosphohydrolase/phosphomutase|tara:strand:+ start:434 stop:652 length:219 start_codon:yes stop_codon:yes gene_type:complete